MSFHKIGPWINVDSENVLSKSLPLMDSDGFAYSPSPYDVPLAVRIDEGDIADPAFAVEFRYLGDVERKIDRNHVTDNLSVDLGVRSGRVYRVIVSAHGVECNRGKEIESVARELESYNSSLSVGALTYDCSGNFSLIGKAIDFHKSELSKQLKDLSIG